MPENICQGCGKKSILPMRRCERCAKVLCDACRNTKMVCRDSPKGTPGCNGLFKPA